MPKSLAVGHKKWTLLAVAPADMLHPTVSELTAGVDISCAVTAASYVRATASSTSDDPAMCEEIVEKVMTNANAEASINPFRYFDTDGKSEAAFDKAFQAMKERGARFWIAQRFTSKKSKDAWASGDEVSVFECVADWWQAQEATGYIKANVPVQVADFELNGTVAA